MGRIEHNDDPREAILVIVRNYLVSLSFDADRKEFVQDIGICLNCGGVWTPCYCMRDD